jgi:hypothetical protein
LVGFQVAGSGGREVHINPEQVVCVLEVSDHRVQVVTTGMTSESSMTLMVDATIDAVVRALDLASGGAASHRAA